MSWFQENNIEQGHPEEIADNYFRESRARAAQLIQGNAPQRLDPAGNVGCGRRLKNMKLSISIV